MDNITKGHTGRDHVFDTHGGIDNVSDTHGRYPWVETIGGRHTLHCIALVENMFLRDTSVNYMLTCVSTLLKTGI